MHLQRCALAACDQEATARADHPERGLLRLCAAHARRINALRREVTAP